MLRKLIMAGGMAYLARKFMRGRRTDYPRTGTGWGRRDF